MAVSPDLLYVDFHSGLSKVAIFLQSVLPKEPLSAEAEKCRKDCITHVEGMNNALNSMKINNVHDGHLLNAGLSISSQSLNKTDEFGIREEGISRSGSLPDMTISHSENSESWKTSGTDIKAFHCSKKYADLDEDINLNDFRELVIYDPIQEEVEDEADDSCNGMNQSNIPCRSSMSSKQKSRKRDSAALFDISLGDLTEPDFAGLLTEKHSDKVWFCVLIDQHLCIFPSQDPDEVAYDVVIMPCCQISLDDRLMRTPVFRLTQSGMQPWVFVASDNDELKEWMKVLTIAASAGKHDRNQSSSSEKHYSHTQMQPPQMQSIDEEEEEETVVHLQDEQLPVYSSLSVVNCVLAQSSNPSSTSVCEKIEEEQPAEYVNTMTMEISSENEDPTKLPKRQDKIDGEPFGEEVYENVPTEREEFEDDGFATDEFDSGSSDGGDATSSPQTLPVQQKAKKKKHFFKWLKKKATKDKLFSSPQDGVALAGYAYKSNINSKRWFLIREEKLHCYKAIKDDDAEVIVDLNGCEIKAGEEEKTKLTIRVTRGDTQEFTLIAKSAKDWERWRKALLKESGFIKLAVTPTENTLEPFDQGYEEDYITPIIPLGMQTQQSPSHKKTDTENHPDFLQNGGGGNEEDLYMEVVPMETDGNLSPASQSLSQEDLGPLPPVPPDLPPRRPQVLEKNKVTDYSKDAGDFEIYEEVSSSVSHADKVVRWDGLNNNEELVLNHTDTRDVMKAHKGEEISKSCKESKVTSGIHKITGPLGKVGKGKSFDKQTTGMVSFTDGEDGGTKPTKPPLVRKVSFDDKVSYIDRPSSVGNHVSEGNVVENGKQIEGVEIDELCNDEESDGYLQLVREASKEERKVELMVQQKIDERRREGSAQQNWRHEVSQGILAKKNLYEQNQESVSSDAKIKNNTGLRIEKENALQSKKKILTEKKDSSTCKSENGPSNIQRLVRKDSESSDHLDKEREDLEKTEKAFQKYAQELKEKGTATVKKERGSSFVARNRLNFEGTDKSARDATNRTKSESILKEKEELLNKLEILKRRIAVAKDRKIFFTLSTSRSKATADADAEFHESQYELAKVKKRLLEIENETKNLKVLELKYQKTPEKSQASPAKKPIVRKLSRECKLGPADVVFPKVDSSNASNPEQEQAQKGSVLSQIKAFETMKEQK